MNSVVVTELTVLFQFDAIRVGLLVLLGNIIALFAIRARQRYRNTHPRHLLQVLLSPIQSPKGLKAHLKALKKRHLAPWIPK